MAVEARFLGLYRKVAESKATQAPDERLLNPALRLVTTAKEQLQTFGSEEKKDGKEAVRTAYLKSKDGLYVWRLTKKVLYPYDPILLEGYIMSETEENSEKKVYPVHLRSMELPYVPDGDILDRRTNLELLQLTAHNGTTVIGDTERELRWAEKTDAALFARIEISATDCVSLRQEQIAALRRTA